MTANFAFKLDQPPSPEVAAMMLDIETKRGSWDELHAAYAQEEETIPQVPHSGIVERWVKDNAMQLLRGVRSDGARYEQVVRLLMKATKGYDILDARGEHLVSLRSKPLAVKWLIEGGYTKEGR